MGKIFCIIGKSATGKDHIYQELLKRKTLNLKTITMYTTRPKRNLETDGKEYYFVDTSRLEAFRAEGSLIECRQYHTVHGEWFYFTVDDGQVDLEECEMPKLDWRDMIERNGGYSYSRYLSRQTTVGDWLAVSVYNDSGDMELHLFNLKTGEVFEQNSLKSINGKSVIMTRFDYLCKDGVVCLDVEVTQQQYFESDGSPQIRITGYTIKGVRTVKFGEAKEGDPIIARAKNIEFPSVFN